MNAHNNHLGALSRLSYTYYRRRVKTLAGFAPRTPVNNYILKTGTM